MRLIVKTTLLNHGYPPDRQAARDLAYGSNQIRVRVARDAPTAWQTTRAIVERLAARMERPAA